MKNFNFLIIKIKIIYLSLVLQAKNDFCRNVYIFYAFPQKTGRNHIYRKYIISLLHELKKFRKVLIQEFKAPSLRYKLFFSYNNFSIFCFSCLHFFFFTWFLIICIKIWLVGIEDKYSLIMINQSKGNTCNWCTVWGHTI